MQKNKSKIYPFANFKQWDISFQNIIPLAHAESLRFKQNEDCEAPLLPKIPRMNFTCLAHWLRWGGF